MTIYHCTLILQNAPHQIGSLAKSLRDFLLEQPSLPVFSMPDLPPGQEAIQLEQKRNDLYLSFSLKCASKKEADNLIQQLSEELENRFFNGQANARMCVAGLVSSEPARMTLELIMQSLNPQLLYAVYSTGAVYEIHGQELIEDLEDPHNPLFNLAFTSGGLRKLSAYESQKVLNARAITYLWARRKQLRRYLSLNEGGWSAHP